MTKAMIERAVMHLNDKAEELGLDRKFEFSPGSRSKGRRHRLVETRRGGDGSPLSDTKIGRSLEEAHAYVTAMQHAFISILADRGPRAVIGVPGGKWGDVKNL